MFQMKIRALSSRRLFGLSETKSVRGRRRAHWVLVLFHHTLQHHRSLTLSLLLTGLLQVLSENVEVDGGLEVLLEG